MNSPVQESLDDLGVFGDYPSNLSQLVVQPNALLIVPCQNGNLIHSFFPSLYSLINVALYLLDYTDVYVEPIQCTNIGKRVFDIRGKDYPPPADGQH